MTKLYAPVFIAALLGIGMTPTFAQNFPSRPVTMIVPFAAGSLPDNWARRVSKLVSEKLGQPVIIDNKGGAGSIIGAEAGALAVPDGYTMLYVSVSTMTLIPLQNKQLSYKPERDFTLVHGLGRLPYFVGVRADSPFKTLNDLIEYARANPGKLNYYSAGSGNSQQLVNELLQSATNTKMTEINYKSTPAGLVDFLGGRLDVFVGFSIDLKPQIEAGKVRALAVTSDARAPQLPDVPTTVELGYPDVQYATWAGIVVPKKTPQQAVDKLATVFGEALEDPGVIKYFEEQGAVVMRGMSKEKFQAYMDQDLATSKKLVEGAGVKSD